MTYIYALIDPRTSECRYVGKSDNVDIRKKQHLSAHESRKNTHKVCWIKSLLLENLNPELVILECIPKNEWENAEIFWIAYMKALGAQLTNANSGGVSGAGYKFSTAQRAHLVLMARHLKGADHHNYGRHHSDSTKQRMSESRKGRVMSVETRGKMSEAMTGRVRSAAHCKKISDRRKGAPTSEDTKTKISASLKGRAKPEGFSAKVSDAIKAHWILRRERKDNP